MEPNDYVRWAPRTARDRLPRDWNTRFEPRMFIALNCTEVGPGDANLGMHRHAEAQSEKAGGGPGSSAKREVPEFLKDPHAAAAVVELADRTALVRINQRCPQQDDPEAQARAWDEEFEKAAAECSVKIDPRDLMRVWSGCLAAAKAISPTNYWIGPISSWFRFNLFKFAVFPECREDELYRLGALAAPAFKAWRGEAVTREGVPLRTCGDPEFMRWEDERHLRPKIGMRRP